MRVGEEIRRRRKERGLSQEALAAAMDVTRQAVTRWESGAAVPSSANLIRLSQVLELPLEELTGTPESAAAQLLARQEQRRNRRMELLTLAGKTALFYGILALFCWAGDTLLGWRVYPWFYLRKYRVLVWTGAAGFLAGALGKHRMAAALEIGMVAGILLGQGIGLWGHSSCGYNYSFLGLVLGWCGGGLTGAALEWRKKRPRSFARAMAAGLALALAVSVPAWLGVNRLRRYQGQEAGYLAGFASGRQDAARGLPRDLAVGRTLADLPEEYEISMPEYHGFMLTWSSGYEDGYADKNDP